MASLGRGRSSLAIGNIIGAAVSNILGAFSLGLLFYGKGRVIQFDRSSRIYSLILLVLTTLVAPMAYFPAYIAWLACGSVLIAAFVIYILFVGVAIGRGVLTAPEGSDSDSDDDGDDGNGSATRTQRNTNVIESANADAITVATNPGLPAQEKRRGNEPPAAPRVPSPAHLAHNRHKLRYHGFYLFLGFLAVCLAGYVLSQAATGITDQFGISDVLFGVVILAIATTLPEKFIAIMSGHRGHAGILVANCAGSNIFLLTLCVGIIMVDTKGALDGGNVTIPELAVLWASTLGLTLTVWFGARFSRWIGAAMLAGYIAFIVVEFAVVHRVDA